jgi:hypothetical protein
MPSSTLRVVFLSVAENRKRTRLVHASRGSPRFTPSGTRGLYSINARNDEGTLIRSRADTIRNLIRWQWTPSVPARTFGDRLPTPPLFVRRREIVKRGERESAGLRLDGITDASPRAIAKPIPQRSHASFKSDQGSVPVRSRRRRLLLDHVHRPTSTPPAMIVKTIELGSGTD